MDFYTVLQIESDATTEEIKKAHRKLVIKYHPDKNSDPGSIEKFRDIQAAYEVLVDNDRRANYDLMTEGEKYELYSMIKKYIPNYLEILNLLSNSNYKTEVELKDDINNFGFFKKIYDNLVKKFSKKEDSETIESIDLDDKCEVYTPINEHDLFTVRNISLTQYLYGSDYEIDLLDGNIFSFNFSSLIDKVPIIKFEGKGTIIDPNTNQKGDLYIYFKIDGVNSLCITDIDEEYNDAIKRFLMESFPSLENSC